MVFGSRNKAVFFVLIVLAGCGFAYLKWQNDRALPVMYSEQEISDLAADTLRRAQDPQKYVLGKFAAHDIVLLGERHKVRHDLEFVRDIIPKLPENGVYTLAVESLCYKDQERIDALIDLPYFDEEKARVLMYQNGGVMFWGYQERLDILRAAWQNNQNLKVHGKQFRLVGFGPFFDPRKQFAGTDAEKAEMRELARKGDEFYAQVIIDEIVSKQEKALVYVGTHHAFSKFLWTSVLPRMGNYIFDIVGNKVTSIMLYPGTWRLPNEIESTIPLGGAIELVHDQLKRPFAMDLTGSALGRLLVKDTTYNYTTLHLDEQGRPIHFHEPFRFSSMFDGLIVLNSVSNFEGPTIIDDWVDTPGLRDYLTQTVYAGHEVSDEEIMAEVRKEADTKGTLQLGLVEEWQGLVAKGWLEKIQQLWDSILSM